ncbi:MAG: pseudouridine synthase, partial [Gammaproteobacteria bacterium]
MQLERTIPEELAGLRLDQALARLFEDYSRARLQKWIKGGQVRLDGAIPRAREPVQGGERVTVTPQLEAQASFEPEDISIDVVHEDEHILVINKPAGLVTHPAAGNWQGTLLNGLLHHAPELSKVPRAGIVHRLDKDTSGLMVVARNVT